MRILFNPKTNAEIVAILLVFNIVYAKLYQDSIIQKMKNAFYGK